MSDRVSTNSGPEESQGGFVTVPASFSLVPEVWCEGCQKRVPSSELDEARKCLRCRGVEAPLLIGLSVAEEAAKVNVSISYNDDFTINRKEFDGTDDEWRLLLGALATPAKERSEEQREAVSGAEEQFSTDWYADGDCDVYIDLPQSVRKAIAS